MNKVFAILLLAMFAIVAAPIAVAESGIAYAQVDDVGVDKCFACHTDAMPLSGGYHILVTNQDDVANLIKNAYQFGYEAGRESLTYVAPMAQVMAVADIK